MIATLDELLNAINNSERTELRITKHSGSEVILKPIYYTRLRISKDDKGEIFLGNYESNEGYIITNEHDILKLEKTDNRTVFEIRRDNLVLVDVYIDS